MRRALVPVVVLALSGGLLPAAAAAPVAAPTFAPGRIVETVGFTNAFGQATTQIWTMAPDGSDRRAVVTDPTLNPVDAVPDHAGRRLAFTVGFGSSQRLGSLFVTTIDGLDRTDVLAKHRTVIAAAASPTWSPDGTRLAFVGRGLTGDPDLWVVSVDGTGLKQLTHCGCAGASTPRWSPVRDTLLWSPDADDLGYHVIGTGFDRPIYDGHPVGAVPVATYDWSPTGNKVAFTGRAAGDQSHDLYSIPLTRGAPTRLTTDSAVDLAGPHYSPDGTQIVVSVTGTAADPDSSDVRILMRANQLDSPSVTIHGPDDEQATAWAAPCASDCPDPGTRSLLSAGVQVGDGGIVVTGGLLPGLSGAAVPVTLQRKDGTVWRTVATSAATTDRRAVYTAGFARPAAGTCRVIATWAGDSGHVAASVTNGPFSC